ncbi:recombinase family protein [Lacipirellula limnantheis]|uniref:recombinase family protein n=1 Tax=Lacipirellula limnantheis TaxID=2528024 RepID=UPI001AEFE302|nr:recombinase family protein [Lacipirellula limnantheis]
MQSELGAWSTDVNITRRGVDWRRKSKTPAVNSNPSTRKSSCDRALARSCKDWYQLLELCALFRTLIADLDGMYDPASYNDRLLLGLKGTMSEAELHVIKQRMLQGALQKARRGELVTKAPIGYVRSAAGEVQLDPDEEVQSFVKLV